MSGLRPSGLHINKPAIIGLIALFLSIILIYKFVWVSGSAPVHTNGLQSILKSGQDAQNQAVINGQKSPDNVLAAGPMTWDLTQLVDPPVLNEEAKKKLARKFELFDVDVSGTKIKVFVQQVINNDLKTIGDVLFLHGAKFSSQNWVDIEALDQVASWGYRAIAVDLPGKGKTLETIAPAKIPNFLHGLVTTLEMTTPIIIAPSMSGQYVIPYLFAEPEKSTTKATAFIPVAPVGTSPFTSSFPKSQLPTLIVYGSNDPSGPHTLKDLQALPKSIIAQVPNAGHACYMDQPASFFKYLHAFLKKLKA